MSEPLLDCQAGRLSHRYTLFWPDQRDVTFQDVRMEFKSAAGLDHDAIKTSAVAFRRSRHRQVGPHAFVSSSIFLGKCRVLFGVEDGGNSILVKLFRWPSTLGARKKGSGVWSEARNMKKLSARRITFSALGFNPWFNGFTKYLSSIYARQPGFSIQVVTLPAPKRLGLTCRVRDATNS